MSTSSRTRTNTPGRTQRVPRRPGGAGAASAGACHHAAQGRGDVGAGLRHRQGPLGQDAGFRRERVLRPTLDANDPRDAEAVILKVKYTGFCGSDAGIWFRRSFKSMIHDSLKAEGKTTRVIGHEVLGEVAEVGAVAGAHYGFQKGDLVSAESHITCGRCHQCLINQRHVCTDERIIGISRDGGFAEYIKLPASVLWRTDPARIRPEVAAIQEPFGNAVHASTAVDLRGKTVAMFGCGAIGQFAIMIAKALGASRIIGIEPNPINAALATQAGRGRSGDVQAGRGRTQRLEGGPRRGGGGGEVQRHRRRGRGHGDGGLQLVGQQRHTIRAPRRRRGAVRPQVG